ncbi:hypothetical protein [Psychromonas sp. MME2]
MLFDYHSSGYGSGKLASLKTYANGVTSTEVYYNYDSSHRLYQVKSDLSSDDNSISDGHVYTSTYLYDGASLRVREISQSDGSKVSFTYLYHDGKYKVHTVTDGTGHKQTYSYGSSYTSVSDDLGNSWRYDFDSEKRLVKTTSPNADGQVMVTQFQYDANDNIIKSIDANGKTTSFTYDGVGNKTSQIDPLGHKTEWRYVGKKLVSETHYINASTPATNRFVYDGVGHLRFTISAEGRVSEQRYNSVGQRVAAITYNGGQYPAGSLAVTTQLRL